jgi:hypothetical protein
MLLAFNTAVTRAVWPHLAESDPPRLITTTAIDDLRKWPSHFVETWPVPSGSITPAHDAVILRTLERRIPIHFPKETPLETVLKSIQDQTKDPDLPNGLPVYVPYNTLLEAEKTMASEVQFDLDGPRLKTALRLILKQLTLDYIIMDGMILVVVQDDIVGQAAAYDAGQRVAHCLIALLAACIGSVIAQLVSAESSRPRTLRSL